MLRATPENGEKTTVGVISKKATLHVQHTFLYISLPFFARLRLENKWEVDRTKRYLVRS